MGLLPFLEGCTGLGLCFAKEITRLHGGKIELHNKESHGVIAKSTLRL